MKFKALLLTTFVSFAQPGIAAMDAVGSQTQEELKVTRITPGGEDVPVGDQVVFQFNRPVVPIGAMKRDMKQVPVDTFPTLHCHWRWLNTRSLACQLNAKNNLRRATKYTITMRPGIRAEDGATIPETITHSFITQRPAVARVWIHDWKSPGTPILGLIFNQPVDVSSVQSHIAFTYGKNDPENNPGQAAEEKPRHMSQDIRIEDKEEYYDRDDDQIWLISPQNELPLDTDISLQVSPGIISKSGGKEPGVEDRTARDFRTFPEFSFLGISCAQNDGDDILITESHAKEKCDSTSRVSLNFSAPVTYAQAKEHVRVSASSGDEKNSSRKWDLWRDSSFIRYAHTENEKYLVHLNTRLKAAGTYVVKTKKADLNLIEIIASWFSAERPPALQDRFGRELKEPIHFSFHTDDLLPDFSLTYNAAVLEKQIDSDVPIYVTNIDRMTFDYHKLTKNEAKYYQSISLENLPRKRNATYAVPMRIREIIGDNSGAVYGEVYTEPRLDKRHERSLLVIVSPYQMHVKIGHYNTLVWVTDMATGEPVEHAHVRLYQDDTAAPEPEFNTLDEGNTDHSGLVSLQGTADLDPELRSFRWWCDDEQEACPNLFVRVDKAGEMAIMPLKDAFITHASHASGYEVHSRRKRKHGHIHAWGTTAQGIYRTGGTIQYKIYVRDQDNDAYVPAPRETYALNIIDPTGKTVHEVKDISLSEFGGYDGEYALPENAAVGWYQFTMTSDFDKKRRWKPMRVLVSDFTPASFRVVNSLNGELFHRSEQVKALTSARLHSGGAYTDAEVRVTATLSAARFSTKHPAAKGFRFDSGVQGRSKRIFQKTDRIGKTGETSHEFSLPKDIKGDFVFGHLTVESAVRDDRGKYVSTSSKAGYVAVDRLIGLKRTQWVYEQGKTAEIRYLVVDSQGTPAADVNADLKIEHQRTKAAKVKGPGNTYQTHYIDEWVPVSDCAGVSTTEPLVCGFVPEEPGSYRITASIKDSKGDPHSTSMRTWVTGTGNVVWKTHDTNRLRIFPEKPEYKIGDKARYLIKNPYPGAKALVSIERYGVLKSWVQELESNVPILEFEIEKNFMPGFYLSVVVVSPRVEAPIPKVGHVDLGKPTFKIGYVKVPVKDPYKQINVSVKTDAEVYQPRDLVTSSIHAEPRHKDKDEKIEIAVAVLDEAVLDLVHDGTAYFDPYEGFHRLDDLDLYNYSMLTRLIGRQKFEKKGANPGGGGADFSMRSLFKYVSYWNPSVRPDEDGNATIRFTVPDNLTGWRILAFAVTPTDRMGLGDGSFKVNRPTEIRPVMPNQITEGDTFQAGFSVMNRTEQPRDITVRISAEGNTKPTEPFSTTIHVEPYERRTVHMPVSSAHLPQSAEKRTGAIHFTAKAMDSVDEDGIRHSVPVRGMRSLQTAANYGSTTEGQANESLQFPENMRTDIGEVSVTLSPSVIGNIDGAFRHIRDYPYTCWEQKLSQGVLAAQYQNMKDHLPEGLSWEHSAALPDNMLQQAANYQAPNGGIAYFVPQDQRVSPYLSAYTALAFHWLRDSGHAVPEAVETKLHAYLERLLREDQAPDFYSRSMSSSVRAVALAALAKHGKVSLDDLNRYRTHVPHMSLFGKAHYLHAALEADGAQDIAKEVLDMILAHSNQTSGTFDFHEELGDGHARILSSALRANCGILSAITKYGESHAEATEIHGIPSKLTRSITRARRNRDYWMNTQENVFCVNSLIDYSRAYESTRPDMRVSVAMDQEELGIQEFHALHDDAVTFRHPISADDLGAKRKVTISREGDGRLHYSTRMRYAPSDAPVEREHAGIDIRKEYSVQRNNQWRLLDNPAEIRRGDLIRVDIYVSLTVARNFVVVDDPVPGGLEPVNRDLTTSSMVDAEQNGFQAADGSWWFQSDDWTHFNQSYAGFYHQEMRHDSVRFYSDHLPAGNHLLSYTAQAIATGEFARMPVHAEEMYNPDVFGKGLQGTLRVGEP